MASKRYVVVNIPAAQIETVEGDRIVSRHAGVVGKPDRPTPILNSAIHELNFNAVVDLPPTVIEKDLIPKGQEMARRGQSVLVKFTSTPTAATARSSIPTRSIGRRDRQVPYVQAVARAGQPAGFRQDQLQQHPFGLHARHALPVVFGRNFRAASSGCVRVQGIDQLAAWILADQAGSPSKSRQMKETRRASRRDS